MPRNQTPRPSLAVARQQPLDLPHAYPQLRSLPLPQTLLRHLTHHHRSIRLFHAQRPFPHHRKYPLRLEQKGDTLTLEKGDTTALG